MHLHQECKRAYMGAASLSKNQGERKCTKCFTASPRWHWSLQCWTCSRRLALGRSWRPGYCLSLPRSLPARAGLGTGLDRRSARNAGSASAHGQSVARGAPLNLSARPSPAAWPPLQPCGRRFPPAAAGQFPWLAALPLLGSFRWSEHSERLPALGQ